MARFDFTRQMHFGKGPGQGKWVHPLLAILMLPVLLVVGAVLLVVLLPVFAVLALWGRHKIRKFWKEADRQFRGGQEESAENEESQDQADQRAEKSGRRFVESVVVEDVDRNGSEDR